VVGWEGCWSVGWKKEEVTGRRVQVCKWLSAYPAMPESALPRANRVFRRRAPMILLTRQSKKKTEFVEIGQNP